MLCGAVCQNSAAANELQCEYDLVIVRTDAGISVPAACPKVLYCCATTRVLEQYEPANWAGGGGASLDSRRVAPGEETA